MRFPILFLTWVALVSTLSFNACSSRPNGTAKEKAQPMDQSKIIPVAIADSYLEGRGLVAADLSESDPNDSNVVSEEPIENSSHVFHMGKIMVAVYQAAPGKVHIDDAKYDEFVQILEGRLILTPDGGDESYEYKTGDSFVVPKGYTGTWHMPEKYRELIVIDTNYLEAE
jgi:uncharacterized cupin superfamily protein